MLIDTVAEKVTAVRHCNGTDIWVIAHGSNSNPFSFFAYLITSAGISAPVISNVGSSYIASAGFGACTALGGMKASPDGSKLACVRYCGPPSELFDFDPSTGTVSNPVQLPMRGYGVEFSPDGTKLYFSAQVINTTLFGIYQFNLCDPGMLTSYVKVGGIAYIEQTLQMATDGKIYVGLYNSTSNPYVGVINNPNTVGTACNYVQNGVLLAGKSSMLGLPNFITSYFYGLAPLQPFTSIVNSVCDSAFFSAPCASNVDSVLWNFGDPSSGTANTSALPDPGHLFTSAGNYNVQLIQYHKCHPADTIAQVINVSNTINVAIAGAATICSGNSVSLTAAGGGTYLWSTGSTTSSISVSPTTSSVYSVTVTKGACSGTGSVPVTVIGSMTLAASSTPSNCQSSCNGTATIIPSGAGSFYYQWSAAAGNQTTQTATGLCPGTYSVTVTDSVISPPTVFWTEDFGTGCSQGNYVTMYTGPNGAWTITASGNNDAEPNNFFVSAVSAGMGAGNCGDGCVSNAALINRTLHVGEDYFDFVSGNQITDEGAAYNPDYETNLRVASPVINCSGQVNISLTFNYLEAGDNTLDDATLWYYNGTTWAQLNTLAKTSTSCGSVGFWTAFSVNLPASASNNPNVKIGFNWTNNIDGIGSNPSFAVDDIVISGTSAPWSPCVSVLTQTVTVGAVSSPTVVISGNNNICMGQNTTLTASGGTSYLWSTGSSSSSISVSPSVTSSYSVVLSAGSCSDTANYTVTVLPGPVAGAGADVVINVGSSTTLMASGGVTYSWVPPIGLSCINCQSPVASPDQTTEYCVYVTDSAGCTDSACVIVTVEINCEELFIPSAFSPNGDNVNDQLCVYNNCIETMSLVIFDRWGEKVFETSDPAQCWEGAFRGMKLNGGVFGYYFSATLLDKTTAEKKGNISLMR